MRPAPGRAIPRTGVQLESPPPSPPAPPPPPLPAPLPPPLPLPLPPPSLILLRQALGEADELRREPRREPHTSSVPARASRNRAGFAFSHTEMCFVLSLVNGSRFQPLQRSRSVIPAIRAIRSSSAGQT